MHDSGKELYLKFTYDSGKENAFTIHARLRKRTVFKIHTRLRKRNAFTIHARLRKELYLKFTHDSRKETHLQFMHDSGKELYLKFMHDSGQKMIRGRTWTHSSCTLCQLVYCSSICPANKSLHSVPFQVLTPCSSQACWQCDNDGLAEHANLCLWKEETGSTLMLKWL